MLWTTIILLSLSSAVFQKFEKSVGLLSFIVIGYLVGTPNYQFNGDAVVYQNAFTFGTDNFEKGYSWITGQMSSRCDYSEFRLGSSLIVYIILFFLILMLTRHVSTITLFYAFAMFPFDNEQVRNAMAALFVLLGAWFLIKFEKKGVIPSLLIIYLGSMFHTLALFFLLLPIIWLFRNWIELHFKLLFSIGSFLVLFIEIVGASSLVPVISEFIGKYSSRTDASTNVSTVYNSGTTDIRIWLVCFMVTLFIAITGYCFKPFIELSNHKYYQLYLCSMILWIPGLILLSISIDYLRILRVISYFYFILIAMLTPRTSKISKRMIIYTGLVMAIILMLTQVWVYGLTFDQFISIII